MLFLHPVCLTRPQSYLLDGSSTVLLKCAVLGGCPDGKAEGNPVDEIRKVVDQVERLARDAAQHISEQVAEGVDAPAHGHDETQCREGLLDMRRTRCKPRLRKSRTRCGKDARLTAIAEGQREDGAGQLTIKHNRADIVFHRGEDQVSADLPRASSV